MQRPCGRGAAQVGVVQLAEPQPHLVPAYKPAPAAQLGVGAPDGVMHRLQSAAHQTDAEQGARQYQQPRSAQRQPAGGKRRQLSQLRKGSGLGIRGVALGLVDGQPPQKQGGQAVGTQHRKGQLFAALGRVP